MVLLLASPALLEWHSFGTLSFQMVLLLPVVEEDRQLGFGTLSFQMVLLLHYGCNDAAGCFGTLSFQMVLLPKLYSWITTSSFGTLSFQMVLLPCLSPLCCVPVLEPCHSRWFYYTVNFERRSPLRRAGGCGVVYVCFTGRPTLPSAPSFSKWIQSSPT